MNLEPCPTPATCATGIASTGGNVVQADIAPESVESGALQNNDTALIFQEQSGFVLPAEVMLDLPASTVLPAGKVVDSYYIHFDPSNGTQTVDAQITSIEEVAGVITTDASLDSTDDIFGTATEYPTGEPKRGLEESSSSDLVTIIGPHTVQIHFSASTPLDSIRIITMCAAE